MLMLLILLHCINILPFTDGTGYAEDLRDFFEDEDEYFDILKEDYNWSIHCTLEYNDRKHHYTVILL